MGDDHAAAQFGSCGICFILTWIALSLVFGSFVIVNTGYVGIVKTFGAVQMVQLEEGFNWKKPIMDEVYHMDTRIRAVSENCVASSNDLQQVHAKLTLQYYVVGAKAPVLYQKVGTRAAMKEGVLRPAMQESAKATTAKWTAENLITQRHLVKAGIIENINIFINHTLKAKDIDSGIVVANVAITDFSFSSEFNNAIEMKVKAEQEALQAENEKNTTITRAEAAAETVKINSDATAFHIKTIADAKASAITMESSALKNQNELLELRMVEKWNGKLPTYNGASGGILLNVG